MKCCVTNISEISLLWPFLIRLSKIHFDMCKETGQRGIKHNSFPKPDKTDTPKTLQKSCLICSMHFSSPPLMELIKYPFLCATLYQ